MQSQIIVWETEETVCCHFWCSKKVVHLNSPRSEVLMLEILSLVLTKKQLENNLTTCKTSFTDVILHYGTFPHHQRSGLLSRYSQTLQIHHSSSLFLCSSNSVECSQHDSTLNLYYAEILSRSYTSSKYRPKHMKNDSFSSEVLPLSPHTLSLLLQTTGS